jgi:hypothetical protein
MEFQAGQVVIEVDSEINSVYFVAAGRLEGALFDRVGKEILSDTFQRGVSRPRHAVPCPLDLLPAD